MVDSLGVLLRRIGPSLKHFKDENVELADKAGIDHPAFEIREALSHKGGRHALGRNRGQAKLLELVHVRSSCRSPRL